MIIKNKSWKRNVKVFSRRDKSAIFYTYSYHFNPKKMVEILAMIIIHPRTHLKNGQDWMLEMSEAGFLSVQVPDVYVPAIVASVDAEVSCILIL